MIKNKYIILITIVVIFILSVYSAFYFDEYFRKLVRFLFEYFTNNKISFVYPKKYIHFASGEFVLSFGIFTSLIFILLNRQTSRQFIFNTILGLVFLIIVIGIYCYFDSYIKLNTYTSCSDGTKQLNLDDLKYDTIFILSLIFAILPTMITEIKRQIKNKMNTGPNTLREQNKTTQIQ